MASLLSCLSRPLVQTPNQVRARLAGRPSSVAALQAEPIRHKLRATGPRRLGICCAGLQPGAHAAEAFPRAVQLRGAGETARESVRLAAESSPAERRGSPELGRQAAEGTIQVRRCTSRSLALVSPRTT